MTIQQFAKKMVETYNQGLQTQMREEFYHDDVVSHEPIEGWTTHTLDDKMARNERFMSLHEAGETKTHMSDAVFFGEFFSTTITMTSKDAWDKSEVTFEELCVFEYKEGKISREWFYYDLPTNLK